MEIAIFEAKDIAGQMKRTDLAATIRQEFVSSNCAFDHLIDVVRGLFLSENLGVLLVLEFARTDLCMRQVTKFAKKPRLLGGISIEISKHRQPLQPTRPTARLATDVQRSQPKISKPTGAADCDTRLSAGEIVPKVNSSPSIE